MVEATPTSGARRVRRRDRHGRGLRGVLAPGSVPVRRSRSEVFDDLVLDAVARLVRRLPDQLRAVEFVVDDVPPEQPDGPDDPPDLAGPALGASHPATLDDVARVVVYRRPIESRAPGERLRAELVHDVVVEQVAELLGLEPESVDPDYGLD